MAVCVCVCVCVAELCPTLCDPMDCSQQAPLPLGFFWQEYWTGLPFPSPGDLPDPGIEPDLLHCRQLRYRLSHLGSASGVSGKESARWGSRRNRCRSDPWVRKILWRRKWQPSPVLLPGKSREQSRLVGYSPWNHKVRHN